MTSPFYSPRSLLVLALAVTGFITMLFGFALLSQNNGQNQNAAIEESSTGEALIGGPFTLVDNRGQAQTEAMLKGRHSFMYFGFTYCPDVCPTALGRLAFVLDQLPSEQAAQIQPIFVSVDPERDTVQAIDEYVNEFHPRLIGLTGSANQVDAIKKAYRVYAVKNGEGEDYLVDHSSIFYVMGPDGKFLKHFTDNTSITEMQQYFQATLG